VKRDPFIYIGAAVATFLVVLLALSKPESALIPVGVMVGVLVFVAHKTSARQANRARPCQVCGRRFRGADMVEHHVNEHRVCDS